MILGLFWRSGVSIPGGLPCSISSCQVNESARVKPMNSYYVCEYCPQLHVQILVVAQELNSTSASAEATRLHIVADDQQASMQLATPPAPPHPAGTGNAAYSLCRASVVLSLH
jgi:hypothetical protein